MSLKCLNQTKLENHDIHEVERFIHSEPFSSLQMVAIKLLSEWRRLTHELNDPNYMYSGRIPRSAILCREADIDKLKAEIQELKKTKLLPTFELGGEA